MTELIHLSTDLGSVISVVTNIYYLSGSIKMYERVNQGLIFKLEFTVGYLSSTSVNEWNHFIFCQKFGEYQIYSITFIYLKLRYLYILTLKNMNI